MLQEKIANLDTPPLKNHVMKIVYAFALIMLALGSCDKGPTTIKSSDIKDEAITVPKPRNFDTVYVTVTVYDTITVSYEYINKLERDLFRTKMELESLRDFTRNLRRDSRDVDLAAMIYYSDNYDNKGNFIIK